MQDDDLEEDAVEDVADEESAELDAEEEVEADFAAEPAAASARKSKAKVVLDEEHLPSLETKQLERDALAKAMEDFLARGGRIHEVPPEVDAESQKDQPRVKDE